MGGGGGGGTGMNMNLGATGTAALGYARTAVDKLAGRRTREQLEAQVGSLAQSECFFLLFFSPFLPFFSLRCISFFFFFYVVRCDY